MPEIGDIVVKVMADTSDFDRKVRRIWWRVWWANWAPVLNVIGLSLAIIMLVVLLLRP